MSHLMKLQTIYPSRNNTVDIIRGIAMLMVVLQHTIAGSCAKFADSLLYNAIWSLQMPLFFIISGYVTRYSRPIETYKDLWRFTKKRTLAYLVPWIVWTFVVRGFIFGQKTFLDVKYLLWHMDSGYWFLMSLWCIVMIYGVSDYLSYKLTKPNKNVNISAHLACIAGGACILAGVGYVTGLSFLDIKLTLYYIPLYSCGYLYGQLQDTILTKNRATSSLVEISACLCLAIWLWLLVRVKFYGVDMTISILAMRYLASLCGSAFVAHILSSIYKQGGGISCRREIFAGDLRDSLPVSKSARHRSDTGALDNDGITHPRNEFCADNCADSHNNSNIETQHISFKSALQQDRRTGITLSFLKWCGINSLAIYLIHGFFLNLIAKGNYSGAFSIFEIPICGLNYIVCVTLTGYCITILLNKNTFLSKILFWK